MPDAQRIYARCQELALHSELPGGLTRVFLSPEQSAVPTTLVLAWMREAGMAAQLDALGNCVGRYEVATRPARPALMLGSHLDTVPDAGRYDGMLGVVLAIASSRGTGCGTSRSRSRWRSSGSLTRRAPGSARRCWAAARCGNASLALLDAPTPHGVTLRDALLQFGLAPATAWATPAPGPRGPGRIPGGAHRARAGARVEKSLAVGVVTAINGGNRFTIEPHRHGGTRSHSADGIAARCACRGRRMHRRG